MTHIIQTKNTRKTLAALTVSVVAGMATLATPSIAAANNYGSTQYERCKSSDRDNQVVGGLVGAVVGGVLGSQVAGNGARTEGSVLGAVLGGAAGAGIADSQRKCRTEAGYVVDRPVVYRPATVTRPYQPAPTYRPSNGYGNGYNPGVVTVGHGGQSYGRNGRNYDRGHTQGYNGGYGVDRVERIKFRIDALRQERKQLERNRYHNGDRYTQRRLREIGAEIGRLKDRKRRIKRRN